jgi:hypothetical protein
MTNKEFLGAVVLVDPEFENDPAGRQGEIGVVTYITRAGDEVYLKFADQRGGVYKPEALFMMKNKNAIFPETIIDGGVMNLAAYKDLFKIKMLLDRERNIDHWNALSIARENPDIWKNCLQSLEESMDIRQIQGIGR